ncbi:hypothetical protein [Williamsia sp.]|uniref:hypothetical protein n=1 Tax=Williamsia sp. TaxID=1872085 RepID=UPI001A203A3A|nr:hypothetical protein [Williamsia sp.]MBJ7290861.1 hypothetical protein [Williamsia sp.]
MNRPRFRRDGREGMRSGTATTLLCMAGLVVAGLGLAYCVHLGAERGDENDQESTSAAALKYIAPSTTSPEMPPTVGAAPAPSTVSPNGGLTVTRSKMLLGTVDKLTGSELGIHMSDGRRHTITVTSDTHFESAHSSSSPTVRIGDIVVVHVLIKGDEMVADLVVDGRVTASSPGN